jgi:hypothetical protein
MSRTSVRDQNTQESFLNSLETTVNTSSNYALVPRDYYSIDKSLKEVESYKNEVETQLKHSDNYLKARKFVKEKFFGKRVKSVNELFNLQLDAMRRINFGLDVINNEARQRLGFLEKYIERINYDYEDNFLGIDGKKSSLTPLLKEYVSSVKKFNSVTNKNEEYFDVERRLRQLKRDISEGGLEYKKMLDLVDDLEREKGALNVLEDFFRYSIQLSERMVEKARRFENHVANTKDAYLLAKDINCGFAAVLKSVQSSSNMISQLQQVLTEGLADMGHAVSYPNLPPYQDFEVFLKSRSEAVKGLVNRADQDKERKIDMQKKGIIK